jgi:hypothetical protein
MISKSTVSRVVDEAFATVVSERVRKWEHKGEFNPACFPDVAQSMMGLGLGDCYAFCRELMLTATDFERNLGHVKYINFMQKPRPFSRSYMAGLLLRNLYFMQQRWYNLRPAERVDITSVRAFYYEHITFLFLLLETYFETKEEPDSFPGGYTHSTLEME